MRCRDVSVAYHGQDYGELYDLEGDPSEFRNRWNDPSLADIRFEMLRHCFDASVFTMDPLPARTAGF